MWHNTNDDHGIETCEFVLNELDYLFGWCFKYCDNFFEMTTVYTPFELVVKLGEIFMPQKQNAYQPIYIWSLTIENPP